MLLPRRATLALVTLTLLAGCKKGNDADRPAPATTVETTAASGHDSVVLKKGQPLAAAVAREAGVAKAKGLKPFVELKASWCPPCKALEKYKDDPQMVAAFKGTYIIQVDVDDWQASDFAALKVNASAIPRFYPLDDTGVPQARFIDGGAWEDDVPSNMGPALDKFFHGS